MGINLGLSGKTSQARFLGKTVLISLSQKINVAQDNKFAKKLVMKGLGLETLFQS